VRVIRQYYAGPSNPRTGDLINPGNERGSESPFIFDLGLMFNEALPEPAFDGLFYWVFGPSFGDPESAHNYLNFDFDRDVATVDRVLAVDLNATSTDLDEFRERGGKLIMYHGWADPLIPGQVSINYALAVGANKESGHRSKGEEGGLRRQETFLRLFMAPGMGHCGGGPGPNVFGGVQNQGGPNDADHNALSALVQWVEQGDGPDQIIATKFVNDDPAQGVAAQRPLCVFPKVAVYKGHGDPTIADSFVCRRDNDHDVNQMPAPEYGP
jgi:feruloyl esterase